MRIKYGCHGSTWELDYDKETDYLDDIINVVSDAGFQGIDVQVALLGKYKDSSEKLKEKLDSKNIELAALTLPFSWESNQESKEEKERADYYIRYLKKFPNALLNVPVRDGINRDNLLKRQKDIINCANSLGERAYDNGIIASFHPASPQNSYFRTPEDYDVLFQGLDTRYIGYTPDAGHIAMGGMNPLEVIKDNFSIVKHVHFKDCSRNYEWEKMGDGDIDFPGIVQMLTKNNYKGWIMVEEETKETKLNPDNVIYNINDYVEKNLKFTI